jgi:hypothetical protein
MRLLDDLTLGRKLAVLGFLTLLGLGLAGTLAGIQARQQLVDDRLRLVQTVVDTASAIAAALQAQVQAGKLTQEQALERFVATASAMRYDHGLGYVFVNTMDGFVLVNATRRSSAPTRWTW